MMYDDDDGIFATESEKLQESEGFQQAATDLTSLSEDDFLYRYKATKGHYGTILNALRQLQKSDIALQEMGALNVDPEIGENTQLLIEDYARLLEQMHQASYWEREGRS